MSIHDPYMVNGLKEIITSHFITELITKSFHCVPVGQTMTHIVGHCITMPQIVGHCLNVVLILMQLLELKDGLHLRNC